MLPVVQVSFYDKIKELVALPHERYSNVRLYGDLTIRDKEVPKSPPPPSKWNLSRFFGSPPPPEQPPPIEDTFNKLSEFFAALKVLEDEILRHDFASLRDPHTRSLIPQAINKLKHMVWYYLEKNDCMDDLSRKCDKMKTLFLCRLPLAVNSEGFPGVNMQIFADTCIVPFNDPLVLQAQICFTTLLKEIKGHLETDDESLENLNKLLAFARIIENLSEHHLQVLRCLIHQLIYDLFQLDFLNFLQRDLVENLFRSPRFHPARPFTRVDLFSEYLQDRLKVCSEGFDSPVEMLNRHYATCRVAVAFKVFLDQKQLPLQPDPHNPNPRPLNGFNWSLYDHLNRRLIKTLLRHLPWLIEDKEARFKLVELGFYKDAHNHGKSILLDLIETFQRKDCSLRDSAPKELKEVKKSEKFQKISRLHDSPFLEKDGPGLCLPARWATVIAHLVPEPAEELPVPNSESFLNFAFFPFEQLPTQHPKKQYYLRFLKGSTILKMPNYFVKKCLAKDPCKSIGLDVEESLIENLLRRSNQLPKILNLMWGYGNAVFYVKLITAARVAKHIDLEKLAYPLLAKSLIPYFYRHELWEALPPLVDAHDEIFTGAWKHLDLDTMQSKHGYVHISMKHFPSLSAPRLNELLTRYPHIDVKNVNILEETSITDLKLTDGSLEIYINSGVLKRSSLNFAGHLPGGFMESQMKDAPIILLAGQFEFIKKWASTLYSPSDNPITRSIADFSLIHFLQKGTIADYLSQLKYADELNLESLFELLDKLFTTLISPSKVVGQELRKEILESCTSFMRSQVSLEENDPIRLTLYGLSLRNSQFYLRLTMFSEPAQG